MAYHSVFGVVRVLAAAAALPIAITACGGGGSGGHGDKHEEGGASGNAGGANIPGEGGEHSNQSEAGASSHTGGSAAGGFAQSGAGGALHDTGGGGGSALAGAGGAYVETGGSGTGGSAQAGTAGAPPEAGMGGLAAGGVPTQAGRGGAGGAARGGSSGAPPAGAPGYAGGAGGDGATCPVVGDVVDQVDGVDVSTLTGSYETGATDGTLAQARFNNPVNTVVSGQLVFVADFDNDAIRKVDLATETVSTLHANSEPPFCRPFGLALGASNELFVGTDCGPKTGAYPASTDGAIWRLDTEDPGDPELVVEANARPRGLLFLPADGEHEQGQLVFSDLLGATVYVLDLDSHTVSLLAGSKDVRDFADGVGADARFNRPYGLALLDGDVIVADNANHALRRVTLDGEVTTIVGNGCPGLVDGPVESALLSSPQDVAVDEQGNVYISDLGNHRIRVLHNGTVRTLAGGAEMGFADGDGPNARFYGQEGFDVTPDGDLLYIADGTGGEPVAYNRVRLLAVPSLE